MLTLFAVKMLTLRQARRKRRMTQVQLEVASGVHQTVISKLELGIIERPSYEIVRDIERALRLRAGSLFFGAKAVAADAVASAANDEARP